MKPLHIALLLAAGAVGGAVIMKISQRPAAPMVAQTQTPPATAPVETKVSPSEVAPAEIAPETAKIESAERVHPSPFKPVKVVKGKLKHAPPVLAQVRPVEPAPVPVPVPVPSTDTVVVAPRPAESAPAPQPVPPAQTEPEHVTPAPPAPPEPHRVTLNAGTLIPVRLVDGLSAERNVPGDSFTGTLDKELVVDGFVIAERGARVEGRVVSSDRGGRVSGLSALEVEIVRLYLSDGQTVGVQSDGFTRRAEPTHNDDAAKVGGGAALGAIIGAVAGGGKGAAIGAGVGGAAGVGGVMATRGKPATLSSEMRITFRLRAPVTITERLRE
jgi:hypothetical protein